MPAPQRPLPPVVVALDVETTGLSGADRIVSIGMVRLETAGLARGDLVVDVHHAFCNPGRPSHWAALKVHGIKDAFLAAQPPFAELADGICDFLSPASLILAHNALLRPALPDAGTEPRRPHGAFAALAVHAAALRGEAGSCLRRPRPEARERPPWRAGGCLAGAHGLSRPFRRSARSLSATCRRTSPPPPAPRPACRHRAGGAVSRRNGPPEPRGPCSMGATGRCFRPHTRRGPYPGTPECPHGRTCNPLPMPRPVLRPVSLRLPSSPVPAAASGWSLRACWPATGFA